MSDRALLRWDRVHVQHPLQLQRDQEQVQDRMVHFGLLGHRLRVLGDVRAGFDRVCAEHGRGPTAVHRSLFLVPFVGAVFALVLVVPVEGLPRSHRQIR